MELVIERTEQNIAKEEGNTKYDIRNTIEVFNSRLGGNIVRNRRKTTTTTTTRKEEKEEEEEEEEESFLLWSFSEFFGTGKRAGKMAGFLQYEIFTIKLNN